MGRGFLFIGGSVYGRGHGHNLFPHPAKLPLKPCNRKFLAADRLIQFVDGFFLVHETQLQLRYPFFHISSRFYSLILPDAATPAPFSTTPGDNCS
jgi:hypothetical protein